MSDSLCRPSAPFNTCQFLMQVGQNDPRALEDQMHQPTQIVDLDREVRFLIFLSAYYLHTYIHTYMHTYYIHF